MNRLRAVLALAAWPILVATMLATGACAQPKPAAEPKVYAEDQPLTLDRRSAWELTNEPSQFDVLAACPVCLFATHEGDTDQNQECVPCAASWAEEWGNPSRPCAWVRPLNAPPFSVCPED